MTEEQKDTEGIVERLRNSPRTVSTIIVILIIAGAIFAFSDRKQTGVTPSPEATAEVPLETASATPTASAVADKDGKVTAVKATPVPTPLPQAKETAEVYTEVAVKGQSITVLARIATKRYMDTNEAYKGLNNEQRVYVEDYLKKNVVRQPLKVGGEVTFSKDLIKKGIEASQKLTDAQQKNLQKYAQRVKWN
ncbi:MAG: hypothetical protein Q7S57_04725 [bacterium]|nr:hypothetical protein [bacterium]